jgi:hypothetical protein
MFLVNRFMVLKYRVKANKYSNENSDLSMDFKNLMQKLNVYYFC